MMKSSRNDLQDLDELDLMIVRELEQDARISDLALASKVGAPRSTVARRVKRLVDEDILTFATVCANDALGYKTSLSLAIKVPPGMVNKVAGQLASLDSIKFLWITAGRYDILATATYRNNEEYLTLFPEEIRDLPENVKIEAMLTVKLIKTNWPHVISDAAVALHSSFTPTELDFSVIRELEKAPRVSAKELAEGIGATASSVRSSLRRLFSHDIVRVRGIPNQESFGDIVRGVTLIQVDPRKLKSVTEKLEIHSCVYTISLVLGSFNCVIWTTFQNTNQMYDFLDYDLGNQPGVVHFETLIGLRLQKRTFNLISGNETI